MKKFIDVNKENRAFLMKAFHVTNMMVWYALSFDKIRGNSDLAKRIRSLAMQRGGIMYNTLPACETIHDADGMMIQDFGNGVMIECNKENGLVTMCYKGVTKYSWKNPQISEYESIQHYAEEYAERADPGTLANVFSGVAI